ncbi:hypothetical protein D3C75_693290 [compost metagenome]
MSAITIIPVGREGPALADHANEETPVNLPCNHPNLQGYFIDIGPVIDQINLSVHIALQDGVFHLCIAHDNSHLTVALGFGNHFYGPAYKR